MPVALYLLWSAAAFAQCPEAPDNTVSISLFDLRSPDVPQDRLYKFLDVLTFRLNAGIREELNSRGLLGNLKFNVRWCSGTPVSDGNAAVNQGKRSNASGMLWGQIDQGAGQLRSTMNFTSVADDKPINDLVNLVFSQDRKIDVNSAYLAFAAYLLGKIHARDGNIPLARRAFSYARDLKSLPYQFQDDLSKTLAVLEKGSAKKLTPIGKGAK